MKDSQLKDEEYVNSLKYIKANNERFSTLSRILSVAPKYIKANNERFSTQLKAPAPAE